MKKYVFFTFITSLVFLSSCTTSPLEEEVSQEIPTSPVEQGLYNMSNWMGALDETKSLTALSIPGTHDSGALHEPFFGTTVCQTLTIDEQLKAGVRYLDIRGRHIRNNFEIYHREVSQNLTFTDVLNSCKTFLSKNPSETIIMSLKEEYTAVENNRSYEATFDLYTRTFPGLFYIGNTVPTLKEAKGKIVLLRRFAATNAKGIDATKWGDNTTFTITTTAQTVRIQDQYIVPNNDAKWNLIKNLADEANTNNTHLYLNYCSGFKEDSFGTPYIRTVSDAINPQVASYFTTNTKGHFGVIVMDFTSSTTNSLIVKTNF
ncbi:phosphatidylinositol-specific phospholipase C [Flavobacterium sp.]|uniref:phosphatidylinositol-specific phospholipase C n=1 Tax=Flavobacterium sp. TaxID=239 RepID=UPI003C5191C7